MYGLGWIEASSDALYLCGNKINEISLYYMKNITNK